MAEKYRHEDCERLTDSFYLEVVSNKDANSTLQVTVLGIIDTARSELKRQDYKMWATMIRLGESVWQRK